MVFGFGRMIRRLIRRSTNPIAVSKAEFWKHKLSLVYMLVGWNAFGIAIYYMMTGRADWAYYYGLKTEEEKAKRPGEYYAHMLGLKNVHVITIDGFKKVGEYEYKGDVEEEGKMEGKNS